MALETATFLSELVATNPAGSDDESLGDNHIRLVKAVLQATLPGLAHAVYIDTAKVDVASATPNIGAAASDLVRLTGTTTITAFDTVAAGILRFGYFSGILTLTHNATSLILPGGANITTAADDGFVAVSLGSGNWRVLLYERASGSPVNANLTTIAGLTPTTDNFMQAKASAWASRTVAQVVTDLAATVANVRAAAAGKVVTPDLIELASALVALTETAGAVSVDWDTFINGSVTVDQATIISNPTNGQPGTQRTILVQGNDATDRTITFDTQFLGDVPMITNCDNGVWYLLTIFCVTTTHFVVGAKRAKG